MPAELETVITAVSPVVDWTDVAGDAKHTAAVPDVHSVAWQATAPIRSDAVKSALPNCSTRGSDVDAATVVQALKASSIVDALCVNVEHVWKTRFPLLSVTFRYLESSG